MNDVLSFVATGAFDEKRNACASMKNIFAPMPSGDYVTDNIFRDVPSRQLDLVQAADYLKQILSPGSNPAEESRSE